MSAPILYSFRRCPYAMRARLALQASRVEVELRDIVLRDKPAALLQASPKATVPVLVLPDGQVLEQSLDIMLWALGQSDPQHWLPGADEQRARALAQIERNDGPFKQALDRYKYPARFGLAQGLAAQGEAAQVLQDWEQQLQQSPFLNGAHWGLSDAAIAPFVRQFAHVDSAWFSQQNWPRVNQWLVEFERSEAFAAVMHKQPLWKVGDAPALTRFATVAA